MDNYQANNAGYEKLGDCLAICLSGELSGLPSAQVSYKPNLSPGHWDMDFDATTGIRFHPIELILSMCVKIIGIIFIGAPLSAVIIFEIILNGSSMFNHGNVSIPKKLDRIMRWFIVTPDMHRVHHSAIKKETNSNYGFNLPWWDRLFGTYCAQPEAGHLEMKIGLNEFSGERTVNFLWLLMQPFLRTENYQKILR